MFEYPITIERTVTVDLDASDWELYTASRDCSEAARTLNVAASEGLSLPTPTEAFAHWEAVADGLAHFGAADRGFSSPALQGGVNRVTGGSSLALQGGVD